LSVGSFGSVVVSAKVATDSEPVDPDRAKEKPTQSLRSENTSVKSASTMVTTERRIGNTKSPIGWPTTDSDSRGFHLNK